MDGTNRAIGYYWCYNCKLFNSKTWKIYFWTGHYFWNGEDYSGDCFELVNEEMIQEPAEPIVSHIKI